MAKGFSPDTSGTLNTSLTCYWRLGEYSGTRYDEVGSQHLTDNNTVTQAAGKVSRGADFESGSSEYLSRASSATLNAGDIDFTWAFWVKFESLPGTGYMPLITKWNTDNFEYFIAWDANNSAGLGTNRLGFSMLNGSSVQKFVSASTFGNLSTGTWYFVVVYHDAAANEMGISVNNGTFDTTATAGGHGSGTGADFNIAKAANDTSYFDGIMDEVGFWKKKLTAQEITDLYNGGTGNTYIERSTTAIGFDAVTVVPTNSSTTSLSGEHNTTDLVGNIIAIVGVYAYSSDLCTGVTYGGEAMTLIDKVTDTAHAGGDPVVYLWYIIDPPTGAQTVTASYSASAFTTMTIVSYTGAKQSGQPDSTAESAIGSGTSKTQATTVVASNCWLVGYHEASITTGASDNINAGAGTIERGELNDNAFTYYTSAIDSNGVVGTGSQSLAVSWTNNATGGIVIASIAPAEAAGGNAMFMGANF